MAVIAQESQVKNVSRLEDERHDTFIFERCEDEYPIVDVSFVLRSLHGRIKVVTDGPYKNVPSIGSKVTHRERPENSPKIILEAAIGEDHKLEIAQHLAEFLFRINEIKQVNEQE